jgi:hypothetical protein
VIVKIAKIRRDRVGLFIRSDGTKFRNALSSDFEEGDRVLVRKTASGKLLGVKPEFMRNRRGFSEFWVGVNRYFGNSWLEARTDSIITDEDIALALSKTNSDAIPIERPSSNDYP